MKQGQEYRDDESRGRYHDDEISLVDLWLVLVRRKWVVFGIAFVFIAAGFWYASSIPVRYEYRTGIELGRIFSKPETGVLLTSREGSVALLEDVIIPSQRKSLFNGEKIPLRVNVSVRGDTHHLVLRSVVEPEYVRQVKRLHQAVAMDLSENHSYLLERDVSLRVKPLDSRAEMFQSQISVLEKQLVLLSSRSHDNDLFSLIDAQQMADIRRELAGIRVKLTDTLSEAEAIKKASHGTRIRFIGIQSEDPVGASGRLIVALFLALGGMAGVFGAFFSEFLAVAKAGKRQ